MVRGGKETKVAVALETAPESPRDEIVIDARSPFLGAKVANLSPALAEELRLDTTAEGVAVVDIADGSVAQQLGFQRGDVVVAVNGAKIAKTGDLREGREGRRPRSGASPSSAAASRFQPCSADDRPRPKRGGGTRACSRRRGSIATRRGRSPTSCGPQKLADVVGQDHLLGPDGALTRMLESALARLAGLLGPARHRQDHGGAAARRTRPSLQFEQISAIFSGVADLKKVFDEARARRETGQGTLLFVDEIHRFNRAQQDSFLPVMEDGTIVLVGATTENPSFELNAPMLSRARVLVFKSLDGDAVEKLLARAEAIEGKKLPLDAEARAVACPHGRRRRPRLADARRGDLARRAARRDLRRRGAAEVVQRRAPIYDKKQDGHYNLISALHKSVRGSDPDAALYYLARMLDAGEDPLYLARRVVRMAIEDIGLADPQALVICNAAKDAYDFLGSPEGELAIAEAVIYVATAPKSNAAYVAYGAAKRAAKEARLAAAAQAHPQRADQADEVRGLRPRLCLRPRRRGGLLRARTTSRRSSAARPSTIRPSAASSAKSGSGWTTGRSCARTGRATDDRTSGVGGLRDQRRDGVVCARCGAICWPLGGYARGLRGGGGSSAATAALTATDTSLSWFDGTCRIAKMYKAKAVYVQAHCPKEDVAVTLDAQGSRMRVTWGKSKPEELKRCP